MIIFKLLLARLKKKSRIRVFKILFKGGQNKNKIKKSLYIIYFGSIQGVHLNPQALSGATYGPTALVGTIYESHCTVSANFYLYLPYFQQKVFSFSKISGSQTNPQSLTFTPYFNLVHNFSIVSIWSLTFQCRFNLVSTVISQIKIPNMTNNQNKI